MLKRPSKCEAGPPPCPADPVFPGLQTSWLVRLIFFHTTGPVLPWSKAWCDFCPTWPEAPSFSAHQETPFCMVAQILQISLEFSPMSPFCKQDLFLCFSFLILKNKTNRNLPASLGKDSACHCFPTNAAENGLWKMSAAFGILYIVFREHHGFQKALNAWNFPCGMSPPNDSFLHSYLAVR